MRGALYLKSLAVLFQDGLPLQLVTHQGKCLLQVYQQTLKSSLENKCEGMSSILGFSAVKSSAGKMIVSKDLAKDLGGKRPGGKSPGGKRPGGQKVRGQKTGGQMTGGQITGGQKTGGQKS